jgi:hypothetical protein
MANLGWGWTADASHRFEAPHARSLTMAVVVADVDDLGSVGHDGVTVQLTIRPHWPGHD